MRDHGEEGWLEDSGDTDDGASDCSIRVRRAAEAAKIALEWTQNRHKLVTGIGSRGAKRRRTFHGSAGMRVGRSVGGAEPRGLRGEHLGHDDVGEGDKPHAARECHDAKGFKALEPLLLYVLRIVRLHFVMLLVVHSWRRVSNANVWCHLDPVSAEGGEAGRDARAPPLRSGVDTRRKFWTAHYEQHEATARRANRGRPVTLTPPIHGPTAKYIYVQTHCCWLPVVE